jgi:hypothetical protein
MYCINSISGKNHWCEAKINWEKPPETMLRWDVEIRIHLDIEMLETVLATKFNVYLKYRFY